jgi:ferric-dicitrate binding protein FerR (iron transport regulator)
MIEPEHEGKTARLLRLAGPRPEVPADRAARVREAVHRQWQTATRRRAVRRRLAGGAAFLAAAATVTLIISLQRPAEPVTAPPGEIVAAVERIHGTPLSTGDRVRTGQWIETDAASRAALRLTDGTSVRLDTGSRARLIAAAIIELTAGAVYIDSGRDSTGLEVRTRFGTAHDIGTQFEVRVSASSLRLRVRSGIVELRRGDETIPARPGTELTVAGNDVVSQAISAHGSEWEWAASVSPAFDIEGRPLAVFLDHLCREQGWTLRYANARLARDASGIILHGSIDGLQPQEALAVALTTSGLEHRLEDGELFVRRPADSR